MVCSKKQNYYFESIIADGLGLVHSDGSALLYTGNISAEDLEAAVNSLQCVKLSDEGWELSDWPVLNYHVHANASAAPCVDRSQFCLSLVSSHVWSHTIWFHRIFPTRYAQVLSIIVDKDRKSVV